MEGIISMMEDKEKEFCSGIREEKEKSPYELIKDLLDKGGSGNGNLSVGGEDILREAFRRKGL